MDQQREQFLESRYWPQLDGLRTVSIFPVLLMHMGDRWLPKFTTAYGSLGVVLFFVISGFLITSLLLREEQRRGRANLAGFYIRRFFRIAPLYYLAVALAAVLILGLDFGVNGGGRNFTGRLPWLATFNGDLPSIRYGTLVHSWSIGVEEKFYILWPLLAFAGGMAVRRVRLWLVGVLLLVSAVTAWFPATSYAGLYTGILAGCAVALIMHTERGFQLASVVARPRVANFLLVVAALAFVLDYPLSKVADADLAHPPFALAVALVFPSLLIGGGWLASALTWRPLVYIGTRTYAIYLFHPFVIDVVDRVMPAGQTAAVPALGRLLLAGVGSLLLAEVLYRTIEHPAILLGRRLTHSSRRERSIERV